MSAEIAPLLLYGVFQKLREAGIPLQIRDYLDGLKALRLYGGLEPFQILAGVTSQKPPDLKGVYGKNRLRVGAELVWLCQLLWARSQEERSIVERVITIEIGLPSPGSIRKLRDLLISPGLNPEAESQSEPTAVVPFETVKPPGESDQIAADKHGESGKEESEQNEIEANSEDQQKSYKIPVEVVSSEERREGDISLPPLNAPAIQDNLIFLPSETQIISSLWLLALWRRFFVPVRKRNATEIDPAATVRSVARNGRIVAPVMKLRRTNAARLLLLIDSSEAMIPWLQFETALVESLTPSLSRLSAVDIRYFNGVPGLKLFAERTLRKSETIEEVLQRSSGSPLLVVGEAGVVRPRTDAHFGHRLERLLALAGEFENRPLIWVNPMPGRRWRGSLMDRLSNRPNVYSIELNPEALLRAVDLMRGVVG